MVSQSLFSDSNPLFKLSDQPVQSLPGWRRTFPGDGFSVGLGLPVRQPGRRSSGGESDVEIFPDAKLVPLAEEAGFSTVWARNIPLRVETFGDDGQIYDPWVYLSYLAAKTTTIALGTAAIVAPMAHPLVLAKQAASLDRVSGGRLLLGVASGDRPEEFAAFNQDHGKRDEVFREHVRVLLQAQQTSCRPIRWDSWAGGKMGGADVVPKPSADHVPLVMTGSCQQSVDWLAEHGDAWMTYHRNLNSQKKMIHDWRATAGAKPIGEAMGLDLAEDPNLPLQESGFSIRTGRDDLIRLLKAQRGLGLNHVSLGLRGSTRPAEDVIEEVGEHVLPQVVGESAS